MSSSPSVTTWLHLLRAGDEAAAAALWRRYHARLVELARHHLAQHVRAMSDEEDIALQAFAEFCAGVSRGRFPDLSDRKGLWRMLLTLTVRRARDLADHETRARRD